jgi:hypothetical protein
LSSAATTLSVLVMSQAGHGDAVDVGGHLFSQRHVDVQHGHLGAQAGQLACGGLAQARCTAGDEGGLSLNVHGVLPVAKG